ncbi:MAG TPA: TylF/MycF/NovP-related O-methyltransferase [Candidatus Lokiarchaeia archaeon]|nr:TylF/MycF/NovP-related O-methyltransferase [Candidatus Lokiarchaeia archaeon]
MSSIVGAIFSKFKDGVYKFLGIYDKVKKIKRLLFKTNKIFLLLARYNSTINYIIDSSGDPIRISTFFLAIQDIVQNHIKGSFAELGVYKGEISKYLHKFAPARKFYLFDTFQGFSTKDLEPGKDPDSEKHRFKDTSLEMVQKNLGNMNNIYIKKGYFPETAEGLESERFAFVLIDVDKYKPTMAGLEFFYPRVTKGGYIFIHDYTSLESNRDAFKAVNEFLQDKPEKVVVIPDLRGTAIFRKT